MKIPAFIINYNRLQLPKKIAKFISSNPLIEVFIIDNNSTYEPLIEWYISCPYNVIRMDGNYGHTVFWDKDLYSKYVKQGMYIITDSDLDLSNIPSDWLDVLIEGHNRYNYEKVGFSLETDDLPNSHFKNEIIAWESQFKTPKARKLDDLYTEAHIDTTFALHKTNTHGIYSSIRVNKPYTARHIPWYYTDFESLPEDEKFYFNTFKTSTLWSRQFNKKSMNIISATYGGKDCTTEIQALVVNDRLVAIANNDIIGDPCMNVIKHLEITYEDDDGVKNISAVEGSNVCIPPTNNTRLGIFYTNNDNAKTNPAIIESLKSIQKAALGKADIVTSVWHRIHNNPFNQYEAWTRTSSHLNQLLQIMQLLFIARSTGKYEYVSFLEHDVLYPEGYFDYPDFETGKILTNMNYGGLCKDGWQRRKQDDEPFHQMTMRFDDAIKHCMDILPNAVQHNSGIIEPQSMERIQWKSPNQAIHINHGYHFTSHNSIYDSVNVQETHTYWGSHKKYNYLFS